MIAHTKCGLSGIYISLYIRFEFDCVHICIPVKQHAADKEIMTADIAIPVNLDVDFSHSGAILDLNHTKPQIMICLEIACNPGADMHLADMAVSLDNIIAQLLIAVLIRLAFHFRCQEDFRAIIGPAGFLS